jgi:hypothetical protein
MKQPPFVFSHNCYGIEPRPARIGVFVVILIRVENYGMTDKVGFDPL